MDGLVTTASQPRRPPITAMPDEACDCHTHVFGPYGRFPLASGRTYSPVEAPLPELLALHDALGVRRLVIVQPSVYGTDNSCTEAALVGLAGRGRGVAVVDPDIDTATLLRMHQAGFRGVRLNFMTAGPPAAGAAETLRHMAERVGPLGWHLQLFCTLAATAALAETIDGLGVPVVLDHFAWPGPEETMAALDWRRLLRLVQRGAAWVKLSAQHRMTERGLSSGTLGELAGSLAAANPDRLLWGTDWPHPGAFLPRPGPGRGAEAVSPLHEVDDARDLDRLADWFGDKALLAPILFTLQSEWRH